MTNQKAGAKEMTNHLSLKLQIFEPWNKSEENLIANRNPKDVTALQFCKDYWKNIGEPFTRIKGE